MGSRGPWLLLLLALCHGSLRSPSIRYCVFMQHANATCYWTPSDHDNNNITYTLTVNTASRLRQCNVTHRHGSSSSPPTQRIHQCNTTHPNCTKPSLRMRSQSCMTTDTHCTVRTARINISCVTSDTHCTVSTPGINIRNMFAVQVTALDTHTSEVARSHTNCRDGFLEAKLHPPVLSKLHSAEGKPQCLRLHWDMMNDSFALSRSEVTTKNILQVQIELRSAEQGQIRIQNRTVSNFSFLVCDLVPGQTYSARMRCRLGPGQGHWSEWSNQLTNSTAEAVPSTSPLVWSFMEAEHVELLWKAPSRPNGRIVNYTVACHDLYDSKLDNSNKDGGGDGDRVSGCASMGQRCLGSPRQPLQLSCPMSLPAANGHQGECVCSVRASNSAGPSPSGYVIVGSKGSRGPPLSSLLITPLGDHQLGLRWSLGLGEGPEVVEEVHGFMVQWSSEYPATPESLFWDWVNGSSREYVIREGLEPEVPCNVSVRALYRLTQSPASIHQWRGPIKSINQSKRGTLGVSQPGPAIYRAAFTRQGAPSAGPELESQGPGTDSVTLSWRPLPLKQLRGFLIGYSLVYASDNGDRHRKVLGNQTSITLRELKGIYNMCVEARTLGGATLGPCMTFHMSGESAALSVVIGWAMSVVGVLIVLLVLTFTLRARLLRSLGLAIPNPSRSSVSSWPSPHLWQNGLVLHQPEELLHSLNLPLPLDQSHREFSALRPAHRFPPNQLEAQRTPFHQSPLKLNTIDQPKAWGRPASSQWEFSPVVLRYAQILTSQSESDLTASGDDGTPLVQSEEDYKPLVQSEESYKQLDQSGGRVTPAAHFLCQPALRRVDGPPMRSPGHMTHNQSESDLRSQQSRTATPTAMSQSDCRVASCSLMCGQPRADFNNESQSRTVHQPRADFNNESQSRMVHGCCPTSHEPQWSTLGRQVVETSQTDLNRIAPTCQPGLPRHISHELPPTNTVYADVMPPLLTCDQSYSQLPPHHRTTIDQSSFSPPPPHRATNQSSLSAESTGQLELSQWDLRAVSRSLLDLKTKQLIGQQHGLPTSQSAGRLDLANSQSASVVSMLCPADQLDLGATPHQQTAGQWGVSVDFSYQPLNQLSPVNQSDKTSHSDIHDVSLEPGTSTA